MIEDNVTLYRMSTEINISNPIPPLRKNLASTHRLAKSIANNHSSSVITSPSNLSNNVSMALIGPHSLKSKRQQNAPLIYTTCHVVDSAESFYLNRNKNEMHNSVSFASDTKLNATDAQNSNTTKIVISNEREKASKTNETSSQRHICFADLQKQKQANQIACSKEAIIHLVSIDYEANNNSNNHALLNCNSASKLYSENLANKQLESHRQQIPNLAKKPNSNVPSSNHYFAQYIDKISKKNEQNQHEETSNTNQTNKKIKSNSSLDINKNFGEKQSASNFERFKESVKSVTKKSTPLMSQSLHTSKFVASKSSLDDDNKIKRGSNDKLHSKSGVACIKIGPSVNDSKFKMEEIKIKKSTSAEIIGLDSNNLNQVHELSVKLEEQKIENDSDERSDSMSSLERDELNDLNFKRNLNSTLLQKKILYERLNVKEKTRNGSTSLKRNASMPADSSAAVRTLIRKNMSQYYDIKSRIKQFESQIHNPSTSPVESTANVQSMVVTASLTQTAISNSKTKANLLSSASMDLNESVTLIATNTNQQKMPEDFCSSIKVKQLKSIFEVGNLIKEITSAY